MQIVLHSIEGGGFTPFGDVVAYPAGFTGPFHVVASDTENPWRLALYRYTDSPMTRLERHPASRESFEPYEGASVLLVAASETPAEMQAFYLDKPVCLHKGVWHQVMALTPSATVKITENLEVSSEFYALPHPLRVVLAE